MRHFALRSPTKCGGVSPPLGVEKSGVGDFLALSLYNGRTPSQAAILMPLLRVRGRGRERAEVAQCVGKSAMSRERDDDAERGRERSKRAKKRHGDRALVCFPICCCASAMSFCASVAVYISCASAGGVKPLPLTSRALVMKVKAIGSHSWMMRLTVLICLRLTTHTSTLCSSPV